VKAICIPQEGVKEKKELDKLYGKLSVMFLTFLFNERGLKRGVSFGEGGIS